MSIIAEIAQQADVSVEGVMRVLTREPVSEDIKERVLAVLPDLSPEQTRILQRFALAALHDELPRQEIERTDALPDSVPAAAAIESRLAPILEELVDAIKDLRQEANAERRDRVDDLALLVDVITTGWQGLDRRLGRVERVVERIEPSARTQPPPLRVAQPPPEQVSADPPLEVTEQTERPERRRTRRWPVAAALVAGLGIGLLAGLDVLPARTDILGHLSGDDRTQAQGETTNAATAPAHPRPAKTTQAAATTSKRTRRPAPKPATTAVDSVLDAVTSAPSRTTSPSSNVAPPAATTTPTQPPRPAPAFVPTRKWGWGPVKGADYYVVDFFRAGQPFFHATPTAANLSLPNSVVFRPGAYRWVVRPGFGKPAEKRLGAAIIDSKFAVSP
ncbi:MAG: hypothetical protein QOF45_900 [Gaiellaceae bacterium]|nr:hypothetical protein [Gaiellaceae bacterium]